MGCCEDSLFSGSRSWWKGAKELPTQICKASLTLALEKDHRSPRTTPQWALPRGGLGRGQIPIAGRNRALRLSPSAAASLALSLCFPWGQ